MTVEEAIFLAKRDIVDLIYASAEIEGIGVTYPDTRELYEGRSVAGLSVDDILKINNLKHAWRFVLEDITRPVDLGYIRELHGELGSHEIINAGCLRHDEVYIGGTSWRPEMPDEIVAQKRIEEILGDVYTNDEPKPEVSRECALDLFCYICRAQLFYDGNKRLAQLAANKVLIAGGVGVLRVPDEAQKEFLQRLVLFYESGDATELKDLLRRTSIRSQEFR